MRDHKPVIKYFTLGECRIALRYVPDAWPPPEGAQCGESRDEDHRRQPGADIPNGPKRVLASIVAGLIGGSGARCSPGPISSEDVDGWLDELHEQSNVEDFPVPTPFRADESSHDTDSMASYAEVVDINGLITCNHCDHHIEAVDVWRNMPCEKARIQSLRQFLVEGEAWMQLKCSRCGTPKAIRLSKEWYELDNCSCLSTVGGKQSNYPPE